MSDVHVGVASVDFTPPPGLPLMGNFRDDYAARGVHDPLCAKAMVFADSRETKAAVLAVDVCMLDRNNVHLMRQAIGEQCDVPPENVLMHATHTHSAPAVTGRLGMAAEVARHAAAIETMLRAAASAVVAADRDLRPAALGIGRAHEDRVSFSRCLRRADDSTQMNWEALQPGFDAENVVGAWGPIDPEMVCLTVRREQHRAAAMVHFGLHPAILAGDNWLYSADYPGYVAEALSRTQGTPITCLYFNGCCGNINHVDYRDSQQGRGFQAAQRVGYMLAATVQEAIQRSQPVRGDTVQVAREAVVLPRLKISPDEHKWCERVLRQARDNPPQGQVDGLPDAYYAGVRMEMHRQQDEPDQVEVMAIRIGDVAIVGLPGEAFCESGLDIKRRSAAEHTLVAGLCNDAVGYLPTREAFALGGYEPTPGSTFYEPGAAERIAASAVAQVDKLFSGA